MEFANQGYGGGSGSKSQYGMPMGGRNNGSQASGMENMGG